MGGLAAQVAVKSHAPTPSNAAARSLAWLLGAAAIAALAAAAVAAVLVAWLPAGGWSGPIAAALVAAAAAPPLTWHALRLRAALAQARLEAVDAGLRDADTGMFRRGPFLVLVEREWARAARYGGAVAMLVIEVDRLRGMTEHSGARSADALLAALSHDIGKRLRGADLLARYDDAQLAVFLPEADPTGALDVADRIREGVERLTVPGLPPETRLTASIGVAVMRPLNHPLGALLSDSANAVANARQSGGNCVRMAPHDRRRTMQRGSSNGDHAARREGD